MVVLLFWNLLVHMVLLICFGLIDLLCYENILMSSQGNYTAAATAVITRYAALLEPLLPESVLSVILNVFMRLAGPSSLFA
jgi:hypothetical protein